MEPVNPHCQHFLMLFIRFFEHSHDTVRSISWSLPSTAPAVADTITAHFEDTGRDFGDYDRVFTGDLGWIGRDILMELLAERGAAPDGEKLVDCGASLFSQEQDPHAGGSGCGCVAAVTCGYVLRGIEEGAWRRVLVAASGAMLSPTSSQQGESIPGISYAAALEADD